MTVEAMLFTFFAARFFWFILGGPLGERRRLPFAGAFEDFETGLKIGNDFLEFGNTPIALEAARTRAVRGVLHTASVAKEKLRSCANISQ